MLAGRYSDYADFGDTFSVSLFHAASCAERYTRGNWRVSGNLMRYCSFTAYSNSGYVYDKVFDLQWVLDLSVDFKLGTGRSP